MFWTAAEDAKLIEGVELFGRNFKKLETHLGHTRGRGNISSRITNILLKHKREGPDSVGEFSHIIDKLGEGRKSCVSQVKEHF